MSPDIDDITPCAGQSSNSPIKKWSQCDWLQSQSRTDRGHSIWRVRYWRNYCSEIWLVLHLPVFMHTYMCACMYVFSTHVMISCAYVIL